MPELAEAHNISKKINKIKIEHIEIINSSILKNDISWIKGGYIENIENYGKTIIFTIVKSKIKKYLVSQLGMTGSWFNNHSYRNEKHNQIIFSNKKNKKIIYSDIRKFGNLKLYENYQDILKEKKWKVNLETISEKNLIHYLKGIKSNKNIKDFLLNQVYFPGIGNYLASEILFYSKINPFINWNKLKDHIELAKAIKYLIRKTKKHGGFSFYGGYILPDGSEGNYREVALVYRKEDCPICLSKINKNYINNRATYFCKKCQKVKKNEII